MASQVPADDRGRNSEFEPVDPAELYTEDGVDLSLIYWMLSLTPTERLQAAQDFVDSFETVADGCET